MPREEPILRKFCYCIPLKSCLQVWSCVKWMADVSLAIFLSMMVMILDSYHELIWDRFTLAHAFLISIILLVIDSIFMIVLTVGLCTNNLRTLRVFFYYSIYMVIMGSTYLIGYLIYALLDPHVIGVRSGQIMISVFSVIGSINTALDICIIVTLKSEMTKLRNKQQYQFVQMPTVDKDVEEPKESGEPFQADADHEEYKS